MLKRTHNCGQLRTDDIGRSVVVAGWVSSFRNHGGILFIDLRDREGVTQFVFDPDNGAEMFEIADKLRREDVAVISGRVAERVGGANPRMVTGQVEVMADEVCLLNKAQHPPILPEDQAGDAAEETRLRYRYIDLRRPRMQHILRTRHRVTQLMRNYLSERGFLEIETPILCRSTPEGARDYLVPSRTQPGCFYALPQSPQIFKQILMASGCDKYMQIVRCFRDEDPRADRQAEFTQLDIEMSFVEADDVIELINGLYAHIWKDILDVEIGDVPRMTCAEALNRFGIDRPDLRFGMELVDVSDLAGRTEFRVFTSTLESGGVVKAICAPGAASWSRKQIDGLAEFAKQFGAGGLPTVKVTDDGLEAGIAKFVKPIADELIEALGAKPGDLICFAADTDKIATRVLGELRIHLGKALELIDKSKWAFVWIVDFPLLEWNDDEKRWDSPHHPFTAPKPEHLDRLDSDPGSVLSLAYDLVVNGSEIAGGSIRIHQPEVQQKVFRHLNISAEEAQQKFSFLLDALQYGCPPHGGIAAGLDRAIMQLVGTENIRDVIAFPKTLTGMDLMTQAPSPVDQAQLDELHITVCDRKPAGALPQQD